MEPFVLLALATALVTAAFAISPRRLNWPLWARAAWAMILFLALAWLLHQLARSPIRPIFGNAGLALQLCWGGRPNGIWCQS